MKTLSAFSGATVLTKASIEAKYATAAFRSNLMIGDKVVVWQLPVGTRDYEISGRKITVPAFFATVIGRNGKVRHEPVTLKEFSKKGYAIDCEPVQVRQYTDGGVTKYQTVQSGQRFNDVMPSITSDDVVLETACYEVKEKIPAMEPAFFDGKLSLYTKDGVKYATLRAMKVNVFQACDMPDNADSLFGEFMETIKESNSALYADLLAFKEPAASKKTTRSKTSK